MSTSNVDFLSMPDDELPEFTEAERQIQEHAEAQAASADEVQDETSQEVSAEEAEQAALEAQANTAEDVDDDEPGEQIAGATENKEEAQEEVSPLAEADDKVKAPVAAATEEKKTEVEEPKPTEVPVAKTEEEKKQEALGVSPEDFQKKILSPFKANGRELQVQNADEAIRLMQMGANYNAKMQALKPNLNMMKQLDEAGLLKPEVIANVIDLLKEKNPAAIAKLAKDAGVDPLEVSEQAVKDYVPQAKQADPRVEALDAELDRIQHSASYPKLMGQLRTWDDQTKQVIADNPYVLGYFDEHMTNGVYDIIESEINRRKALGTLGASTSFIAAYKAVGDELQSKGAFNEIGKVKETTSQTVQTPAAPAKVVSAPAPAVKPQAAAQRRAAAMTSVKPSAVKQPSVNPLEMSDDEFEKASANFLR